jgi:hypothetical protein
MLKNLGYFLEMCDVSQMAHDIINKIESECNSEEIEIEALFDDLISDPNYLTKEKINMYPSNVKGSCHKFCLVLAQKKFDQARVKMTMGFKGAMHELTQYWWSCYGINKETVIITKDWDQDEFDEKYEDVIGNYERNMKSKVIILEITRNGIIPRYPYIK